MTSALKKIDSLIPDEKDIEMAKVARRALVGFLHKKSKSPIFDFQLLNGNQETENLHLSAAAVEMLLDILTQMAKGNGVSIVSVHAELTTQEAAELLNVSRPFIIRLLESGKISYKLVGTRRKILLDDLMEYKESMYHARLSTLDKLTEDAQDLGMGY